MKKIKVVWCAVSVAVMALIFFFSSQTADVSSDTSGGFAEILAKGISLLFTGEAYDAIMGFAQWVVRKSAHFSIFALLGFCVYKSLNFSTRKKRIFIALAVCALYAVSDEVHQLFVAGRACRMSDVCIDGTGSFVGGFAAYLVRGTEVKANGR